MLNEYVGMMNKRVTVSDGRGGIVMGVGQSYINERIIGGSFVIADPESVVQIVVRFDDGSLQKYSGNETYELQLEEG